jgi:putative endonuclease
MASLTLVHRGYRGEQEGDNRPGRSLSTGVELSTGSWAFVFSHGGNVPVLCHSSSMTRDTSDARDPINPSRSRNLRTVGAAGEDEAAAWFTARGYVLLDRNYFTTRGEVDIILHTPPDHPDHPALVFVEVKWRLDDRYGVGAEAVTPAKLRAMRAAATRWLDRNPQHRTGTLRFDVLDITAGELTHYEGVE